MPIDLADPYKGLSQATLTALRAMEARAKTPRRNGKAKAAARKPMMGLPSPPPPDLERMAAALAEIQALSSAPEPSRLPLGPEHWIANSGPSVTAMDEASPERRNRIIRRVAAAT